MKQEIYFYVCQKKLTGDTTPNLDEADPEGVLHST